MREALTTLHNIDLRQITYPLPGSAIAANDSSGLTQLERYLRSLEVLLPVWSNNLSTTYFSHARTLPISVGQ
jgi:hypothetical protein